MENYNDERDEFIRTEILNRCRDIGNKVNILFWLYIGSLIMTTLLLIIGFMSLNSPGTISALSWISSVAGMAIAVAITVVTFTMGKHYEEFKSAAVYYIIQELFSLLYNVTGMRLFQIIAAVLTVFYVLKFSEGMKTAVNYVDNVLAADWERFKTFYVYVMIGTAACCVLAFVPIINLIAALGLIALAIALLVALVWQLILLYKSSYVLRNYMPIIN